jgi:hypothetical protein
LPLDELAADRELALRQLRAYRYLVGVPHHDLALDATLNAYAHAGAEICAALGDITHEPANPGWPKERYDAGYHGAHGSNLHQGHRACTSVRGYMDDSDPSNVDRVGHRCWCMNPAMQRTGFGHLDGFTAMWAGDRSRAQVPEVAFVALPAPGFAPAPWFGPRWAWSVSLDPKHFDAPVTGRTKARIEPVGAEFLPTGEPLALDYENVKQDSVGIPYLVVFRPAQLSLDPGRRYRVTLDGLFHKGKPIELRYYVEFFDLPYVEPSIPGTSAAK